MYITRFSLATDGKRKLALENAVRKITPDNIVETMLENDKTIAMVSCREGLGPLTE